MEYKQVCENGHKFSTDDGELHFKVCPHLKCATKMRLELDIDAWRKNFGNKLKEGVAKGLSRGKLIDSLLRLPWFSDALKDDINDPDQQHAHREWTKEDDEELAGLFAENGIANHIVWAKVAKDMGRSLYAVERQLRVILAKKEYELDELHQKEVV